MFLGEKYEIFLNVFVNRVIIIAFNINNIEYNISISISSQTVITPEELLLLYLTIE